ncbi:MAG: peptidase [Rubellimicrobium sp.]|nr:peptidase [Rubellimicrobium sp.]
MTDPVAAARRWLGTPFVHRASCRGAGADCLGLVRGLWRDCLGAEPAPVPPYGPGEGDPWPALARHLAPGTGQPGDILLFRVQPGAPARHLGIASGPATFIHAWRGHGVVETRLSGPWARRVVARFGFFPVLFIKE